MFEAPPTHALQTNPPQKPNTHRIPNLDRPVPPLLPNLLSRVFPMHLLQHFGHFCFGTHFGEAHGPLGSPHVGWTRLAHTCTALPTFGQLVPVAPSPATAQQSFAHAFTAALWAVLFWHTLWPGASPFRLPPCWVGTLGTQAHHPNHFWRSCAPPTPQPHLLSRLLLPRPTKAHNNVGKTLHQVGLFEY